jgi:hypothetical protein
MNYLEEDLDLYELTLEEETDGVFAVSAVEEPAIQRNFVYMNKQEVMLKSIDDEKRLLIGPLLVPNQKIPRFDEELGMYNIYFSADTISEISKRFMKNKYNSEVTVEHDKKVKDVYLVESWIVEQSSKDKSNLYGYTLPKGTWMGIYRVDNDKVWEDVKLGKYKGFSVEAILNHKKSDVRPTQLFTKDINDLNDNEAEVLLSYIRNLIKKDLRYKKKSKIEMESFADYPDGVKNNAKNVLEWVDRNGWGSCGTPVGKQRANQLAKGEPISLDTIKRMYSYLSRHEKDLESSTTYGDGCGKLMYDSWGGKSALSWSRNKLRELGELGDE